MGMLSTIATLLVEIGADTSKLKAGMAEAVAEGKRSGDRVGSSFAVGFSNPLMNAVSGLNQFTGGLRAISSIGVSLSGLGIAAQMESARRGIQGATGDLKIAKIAWDALRAIDARSPFTVGLVEESAKRLLAARIPAGKIGGDMQAIVDAAAGTQGGDASVEKLSKLIARLNEMPHARVGALANLAAESGIPLDRVVSSGSGHHVAPGGGAATLAAMTGKEAANVLLKGFEKEFAGAADAAASDTLLGLGASLTKSLQLIMEPTGEALAPALEETGAKARDAALWLGRMNATTGGGAGLAGIAAVGVPILFRLAGGVSRAMQLTDLLTTSLERYSMAAKTGAAGAGASGVPLNILTATIETAYVRSLFAASSVGGSGSGGGGGAGGALVPAGAGAAASAGGAEAAAGAGLTAAQRLMGAGKAAGGQLLNFLPLIGSLTFGYAADQAQQSGHPQRAADLQKVGSGIGTGSLIGTLVGGAIGAGIGFFAGGGVGALPGAAIGSRWGGLAGGAIGGIGAAAQNGNLGSIHGGELARIGLTGAAAGGMAGLMLAGPLGGLIGAGAGGAIALVADAVKQSHSKSGSDPAAKNTAAIEANTQAIKTSSMALGGGARTRAVTSQIEMQYSVFALIHSGISGIG